MQRTFLSLSLVAAAFAATSAAQAATTIDVSTYSQSGFQDAQARFESQITETFEGYNPGEYAALESPVGTFTSEGGTGTGAAAGGTGTGVFVRDGNAFGRINTTQNGSQYLDSNDTLGIDWQVATGSSFDRLLFSLSDPSDEGATLKISANGTEFSQIMPSQPNGTVKSVLVSFSERVESANLSLMASQVNDGFAIDDATVATAVPLPPAVALMGAGLAGLGLIGRRRA